MNKALMGLWPRAYVELQKAKAARISVSQRLALHMESPVLVLEPRCGGVPKEQLPAHAQVNQKVAFTQGENEIFPPAPNPINSSAFEILQ